MGIEARRNIKDDNNNTTENTDKDYDEKDKNKISISDEITKLNDLKNKGILSEEEYEKAKDKLIN